MICWKTFLASGSELFPFLTGAGGSRGRYGKVKGEEGGTDKNNSNEVCGWQLDMH